MKFSFLVKSAVSATVLSLILSTNVSADQEREKPILVIGASYENSLTPLDDNIQGPFGGFANLYGSQLTLGDALVRDERLSGFVINEAQGGATTFTRLRCGPTFCLPLGWEGMDLQFQRALSRVAMRDASGNILGYNADYVVIGMPNDCLHSGAMGIPHQETSPCNNSDLNGSVDRLRDIAQDAVSKNITPVFNILPKYNDVDFATFKALFNMAWVIDETTYNEFRDLIQTRIQAEVPETIFVDGWEKFVPIEGDGLHPDYESTEHAAKRIAQAMHKHQVGQ
ncbi:hypothetical protein ACFL2V_10050 [Pseudomonadota bacterium]